MGAAGSIHKNQPSAAYVDNNNITCNNNNEVRNDTGIGKFRLSLDLNDVLLPPTNGYTASQATPSSTMSALLSPTARKTPKFLQSAFDFPSSSFIVKLEKWNSNQVRLLPPEFLYHVSKETVDFLDCMTGVPILQFPVQNIMRWGYNSHEKIFQFDIFDWKSMHTGKKTNGIKILLSTTEGPLIEKCMSEAVTRLMDDITSIAISKESFESLLHTLFDADYNLSCEWKDIFSQYTTVSRLTAKQGIHLLTFVGKQAPFEKLEFACLMYDKMLYKESFQVIISAFDDPAERQNIVHILVTRFGPTISSMYIPTCCLGHASEPMYIDSDDELSSP